MSERAMTTVNTTTNAPVPVPVSHHDELLLRCNCGVEMMTIDLWFTTNLADLRVKDKEARSPDSKGRYFDEGYLTVTQGYGWNQPWRNRIKAAWQLLRGREHVLSSVILNPEDHRQIAGFFKDGAA